MLFGLNLGDYDVSRAANEASYVSADLQGSLHAFQIGNEADLFHENGLRAATWPRTPDSLPTWARWGKHRSPIRWVFAFPNATAYMTGERQG